MDDLKYYMVFASRFEQPPGVVHYGPAATRPRQLVWDAGAIGVFRAPSPELACQAAARKVGSVGSFFALEGTPFGVMMNPVDGVDELDSDFSPNPPRLPELTAK